MLRPPGVRRWPAGDCNRGRDIVLVDVVQRCRAEFPDPTGGKSEPGFARVRSPAAAGAGGSGHEHRGFRAHVDASGSYARQLQRQNQPLIGALPLPANFPFDTRLSVRVSTPHGKSTFRRQAPRARGGHRRIAGSPGGSRRCDGESARRSRRGICRTAGQSGPTRDRRRDLTLQRKPGPHRPAVFKVGSPTNST